MSKKLTTSEVISQFIKVHGNKYDYSLVEYINTKTKVKIICKEHGEFLQRPYAHTRGAGCPICAHDRKIEKQTFSQEQILKDFKKVHGNKYDYSLVNYKTVNIKVKIICKEHGLFEQLPSVHKKGKGCPKCIGKNLSTNEIIIRFNEVHKDRYDYSLVEYINAKTKVKIICKEHGIFEQTPDSHKRGVNCPKCGTISTSTNQTFSQEQIISQFKQVHGDRYNYDKVVYKGINNKVKIICKEHGEFLQSPDSHKRGIGCPTCGFLISGRLYLNKPTILYYIKVNDLYKIGITTKTIEERYKGDRNVNIKVIKIWKFETGRFAYEKEQEILKKYKKFKYVGEDIITGGNNELFTKDVLGLDSSWD